MRAGRLRLLGVLLLVVSAVPLVTAAGNGSGDAARTEHQRIIDFWTPERVAQAVPRDFVFDSDNGRFKPTRPGNGGGGGKPDKPGGGGSGDESSVVTGASWNSGGAITGSIGKVLFEMGGSYWVCSATAVSDPTTNSRSIVATAAHCVYDESDPAAPSAAAFASNWMFVPDYDAAPASLNTSGSFCVDTLHGCWTAESLTVHSGYADAGGFNTQAVQHDYGFAVVGLGGHDLDVNIADSGDLLEDIVAPQVAVFSSVPIDGTTTGWAFGYPAQKKWKGNDLIYCMGPVDGDPFNSEDTYRMNECKLTGGSSGGGWLSPFDDESGIGNLFSVNSYGYTGVNAMHGPMFGPNTEAVYDVAVTTNGSTVVE